MLHDIFDPNSIKSSHSPRDRDPHSVTTELPPSWERVRLGDLGAEVRGQVAPEPGTIFDLYSVPAFATGLPEQVNGESVKSGKRPVEEHDVLLCKINPRINRVWIVGPSAGLPQVASTEYLVLRPHEPQMAPCLRYYLSSPRFRAWIRLAVEGATGSHTRAKSGPILEQLVPVPPRAEQERIVAAIEEHFSRLDAAEESLGRVEQRIELMRRSVLATAFAGRLVPQDPTDKSASETLHSIADSRSIKSARSPRDRDLHSVTTELPPGWVQTTVGDVATLVRGVTFKKHEASSQPDVGLIPVVRAGNVQDGRIRVDEDLVYVPAERVALEQYLCQGDTLIATSSGSLSVVGKSALVRKDWAGAHGAFMAVLRPHSGIQPAFLSYWLQGDRVRRLWRNAAAGTNINNLKRKDLLSTAVYVCSRAEQERIVAAIEEHFSRLDAAAATVAAARKKLDATRRSVLMTAFAGRLVPQDPTDEPASAMLERIKASAS